MIEGNLSITPKLNKWLNINNNLIYLDVNDKGCHGNTITYIIEKKTEKKTNTIYLSSRLFSLISNGLQLEIDYLEEPLFQKVHINILNKDKCSCGKSVSL